jgi:hypothetical protein
MLIMTGILLVGSGGNEKQTNSITLIDYILMMVKEFLLK